MKLINEFISIWTSETSSTERQAVPSAVNGPLACRPPPNPFQGDYSHSPGPERDFTFVCPRSTRLATRWLSGHLFRNPVSPNPTLFRTREASEPYSCGQWDSALKATPHSPKGDVSYVGALKQTVRSDAHGFRSRCPRSLLTVLNFSRIRVSCISNKPMKWRKQIC